MKQIGTIAKDTRAFYQIDMNVFTNIIVDLYEVISLMLYVCLTYLASSCIQQIIDDVQNDNPLLPQPNGSRLRKWKRNYCSIINFVQEIGNFFELALFFLITKQFFKFTIFLMDAVLNRLINENSTSFVLHILRPLQNTVLILMVVVTTQGMKTKAN